MERLILTEGDRKLFMQYIKTHKLPFRAHVWDGRSRSVEQNRLLYMWYAEIARQLDDRTIEEVRGECKLTIGVPILRAENEKFHEKYDAILKPLSYEKKLALMMEPLDLPVTRLMKVKQMSMYLDEMQRRYSQLGVKLTVPEDIWL